MTFDAIIVSKGMDPKEDSYSVFQCVGSSRTGFKKMLSGLNATDLLIGGLATDYCVKFTVLDALKLKFNVYLLTDAIKGVNRSSSNASKNTIEEMQQRGSHLVTYKQTQAIISSMNAVLI